MSTEAASRPTALTPVHERLGASFTDFGGWWMPLRYGSDMAEHRAVREAAGQFDLSHMGELLIEGPDAAAFLDYALVGRLSTLRVVARARFSATSAAAVTWAIMKPEFSPPSLTRKAGRPDMRESMSSAIRRSDSDPISAMARDSAPDVRSRSRAGVEEVVIGGSIDHPGGSMNRQITSTSRATRTVT